MTDNYDDNMGYDGGDQNSGGFKLELSEEEMMTGTVNLPRMKTEATPYQTTRMSNKKGYYTEKERKQESKEHKKRNKIKSGKNKRIFSIVWLAMVLLVSFTIASYLVAGANDFLAKDRKEGTVTINVPENITSESLAKVLYDGGAINREDFFTLYCKITAEGKDKFDYIEPGEHTIAANIDYEDIINTLMAGNEEVETVRITFPEGVNALDIAKLLAEHGVCKTEQEALDAMNSMDFTNYQVISELSDIDPESVYYKIEGYMYPDTFDFYVGENLQSVFGKLINNYQRQTNIVNDQIAASGMSRNQIMTLASIIQREAANVTDMYMISAILHNRLNWGAEAGIYGLECDSTMYYPYRLGSDVPTDLGGWDYRSKYDTYTLSGLPAGPICNPGIDAIKAALSPSPDGSSYLYFCHSADGKAYYASNADEHYWNTVEAGLAD